MKDVYARLEEDFRLRGLPGRSRKAYLGAVRQLERHSRRPIDELGDEDVRGYFLHLIDVRRVSPSTVNQHLYAIKSLYRVTLRRELPCLATIRPKRRRKLPVVLSVEEVRSVLARLRVARIRACMTVIYSCGLRLLEGTHLAAAAIDSDRMLLRVEPGKGDKDRYVPLVVLRVQCAPVGLSPADPRLSPRSLPRSPPRADGRRRRPNQRRRTGCRT